MCRDSGLCSTIQRNTRIRLCSSRSDSCTKMVHLILNLPRMWNSVLDLVAGESCLMRITGFNINAWVFVGYAPEDISGAQLFGWQLSPFWQPVRSWKRRIKMVTSLNRAWSWSQLSQREYIVAIYYKFMKYWVWWLKYDRDPKPFKCNIKPRSVEAAELIKQSAMYADYINPWYPFSLGHRGVLNTKCFVLVHNSLVPPYTSSVLFDVGLWCIVYPYYSAYLYNL